MSLMSKNKPTKRVSFDGGWVELQHLSKGIKDEYQSRMAGLVKDLGEVDLKDIDKAKKEDIPQGINLDALLTKVNSAEYYKLSHAIKSWSEKEDINEQTVRDLDEEIFAKISKEINEMNELQQGERKN